MTDKIQNNPIKPHSKYSLSTNPNSIKFVDGIRHPRMGDASSSGQKSVLNSPPTRSIQKSATLARAVVQKPTANPNKTHFDISTPIVRHKKPYSVSEIKHHPKHELVKRSASVPVNPAKPVHHLSEKHSFVPIKKTEEMIQEQLSKANAHLMTFGKPKIKSRLKKKFAKMTPLKRRFTALASVMSVVLLALGTLIYWNLPGISMSIASRRAGFDAYLPSYTPNGFSIIKPIGYTKGRVVISFKSNTNDMKYSIEQKPSNWTTDILRDQVTSSNGNQFQTQSINGLTVYFTAENSATWVDRGLLFTFQGNSGLSSDQIASIAASM